MKPVHCIQSPNLPAPGGHYSQAIRHGDLLYVSGQLGRLPHMSDEEAGDVSVQTRRALSFVGEVVRAAGGYLSCVLKVTVYISDVALWPAVNAEYAAFFGDHRPARSIVPTGRLHHDALVEIDAIAAVG
jgi:reactive intermediate/imine deaminase